MKSGAKQILALAFASCLGLAGSAIAATPGGSHGNSSSGMSQRSNAQTGPGNSEFGRNTAASARTKANDADDDNDADVAKTKKVKRVKSTTPGNSAFGRNQRNNHLKGSGNNVYGKTTSARAKAKHLNKDKDNDND